MSLSAPKWQTVPSKRAYSLVELIVTVGVIAIIFSVVSPLFLHQFQSWNQGRRWSDLHQNMRETLDDLSTKLRTAQSISALVATGENPSITYIDKDGEAQTFGRFYSNALSGYAVGWNNVPLLYPVTTLTLVAYKKGVAGEVPTTTPSEIGSIYVQITLSDLEGATNNLTAETQIKLAGYDASSQGENTWPMFHRNNQRTGLTTQALLDPNQSGEILTQSWRYTTSGSIKSTPVIQKGMVFFGSDDKYLYAFLTENPLSYQWRYAAQNMIQSTPVAMNNVVYFGDNTNRLYALNLDNGSERWTYSSMTNPPAAQRRRAIFSSHLVVTNNTLYAASQGSGGATNYYNLLYAVDATTGAHRWSFRPANAINAPLNASPAVVTSGGFTYLYLIWGNGKLYKLRDDGSTASKVWETTLEATATISYSTPTVIYSPTRNAYTIYIGNDNRNLFAIQDNGGSGTLLWNKTLSSSGGGTRLYSPAVYSSASQTIAIIARNNGRIYAINDNGSSGTELWNYNITGDPSGSPIIANGVVYAGSSNGNLVGLKLSDGTKLFSTDLGNDNFTSPAVGYNLLFIGGGSTKKFYAFKKQ